MPNDIPKLTGQIQCPFARIIILDVTIKDYCCEVFAGAAFVSSFKFTAKWSIPDDAVHLSHAVALAIKRLETLGASVPVLEFKWKNTICTTVTRRHE